MKPKSGGGITMSKNVQPPVKTGAPSRATSPAASNQLGASTAFKKDNVDVGPAYHSGVKLGNEKALDVGKGGPGTGRTTMPFGSQGTHGATAPGEGQRGEPRGFDVRGRGKDQV